MSSQEERFQLEEEALRDLVAKVRDLHLIYKELRTRHGVNFDPMGKERAHKLIYFSKAKSKFLQNPDKQHKDRKEIVDKLAEPLGPGKVPLYPDYLQNEFELTTLDLAPPRELRSYLGGFYAKRVKWIRQLRSRLMERWVFACKTVAEGEQVDLELGFTLGKLQQEMDCALQRVRRLEGDDDFGVVVSRPQPITPEGTSLFASLPTVAHSSLVADDVEVYLRIHTYQNKCRRAMRRTAHGLQWLWVQHRHSIWGASLELLQIEKATSIARMRRQTANEDFAKQDVKVSVYTNINLKNIKRQLAIMDKVKAVHSTFAELQYNKNEMLLNSYKDEFDLPPQILDNVSQLQASTALLAPRYNLIGDLAADDGHSLAYQVSLLFPRYFGYQKQRFELSVYDAKPEEKDLPVIRYANLLALKLNAIVSKPPPGEPLPDTQPQESLPFKLVRLKPADWLDCVQFYPQPSEVQIRQDAELAHIRMKDKLLEKAFEVLDVQDLPTINKTLELFSQDYFEMSVKRGLTLVEVGSKQTDARFKYFSDLLKRTTEIGDGKGNEGFPIPPLSVKSLYSLKLLEARTHKLELLDILNAFRSVQRRLAYDMVDMYGDGSILQEDKEVIGPSEHYREAEPQPRLSEGLGGLRVKEGRLASTIAATCPILPSIHHLYARSCHKERYTMSNLLSRRDIIEIEKREIAVKDSAGVYIQYEVVRNDFEELQTELLHLGSFYIEKYENFYSDSTEPRPAIDRDSLRNELLENEVVFQRAKLKVLLVYLDIYDHLVKKGCVRAMVQHITDLMSLRPRLNLHASYFVESYRLHTKSLKAQRRLLRSLCDYQVRLEKQAAQFAAEDQFRLVRLYAEREGGIDPALLQSFSDPSSAIPLEKQFEQEKWFLRLSEGWPLRPFTVHSVQDLGFTTKYEAMDVFASVEEVVQVVGIMNRNLRELELLHGTENPVSLSALETALWTEALTQSRILLESSNNRIESGNLLDSPELSLLCVKELMSDVTPTHPRLLKDVMGTPDLPSQLTLICNLFEAYRLKELLITAVENSRYFTEMYRKQREGVMRKDGGMDMSEPAKFETELKYDSSLEEGPGTRDSLPLSAWEFDPRLKAVINFSSKDAVKMMLLPSGMRDLRAVTQYQKMQEQLLLIAVQINQYAYDVYEKQLVEIGVVRRVSYICKNTTVNWKNVLGKKGEGFVEEDAANEEKRLSARAATACSKLCLDINALKASGKFVLSETFQRRLSQLPSKETITIRHLRASLTQGYCLDTLRLAYNEALKLQLLHLLCEIGEKMKVIPPSEPAFIKGNPEQPTDFGLINSTGALHNLLYLPSIEEVLTTKAVSDDDRRKWEVWSPYSQEQPETDSEDLPTLYTRNSKWRYVGRVRLMLEALNAMLQLFSLQLFTNLLGCPALEVVKMQAEIREGNDFWAEEERKELEELAEKAAAQLLSQQTSQAAVIEEVKRAVINFKQTISQVTGGNKEKLAILISLVQRESGMLQYLLHMGVNYCLQHDNEFGAVQFGNMLGDMEKAQRGEVRIHGKTESELEALLTRTVLRATQKSAPFPYQAWVLPSYLDMGLILLQPQTRTYCLALQTGLQLKLDDQRMSKQLLKSSNLPDVLSIENAHISLELQCLRLRWAWMTLANGKGVVTTAEEYDSLCNLYRDQVEWKIEYAADKPESPAERETNKLKAEIYLIKSEFQREFCQISIHHLEREVSALSNALETPSEYSQKESLSTDPSGSQLDLSRKVGVLHQFLNTLRNRGSLVETPMSGKALVFSLRDMAGIVKRFCSNLLRWGNDELRLRSEVAGVQHRALNHTLYMKEQQLKSTQHSLNLMKEHFDKLVNSQLSQKGNQLIYELDTANRQLKELKDNYGSLESSLRELIYREFEERLNTANQKYASLQQQFRDFRNGVTVELSTEISNEKKAILGKLKERQTVREDIEKLEREDEARRSDREGKELVKLHAAIRKMRTFHQWARLYQKEKFEQQVEELKERLSSNQYLLEQLSELQRREALLKQELAYTQQALAASEKLADKMQSQIEEMNNQRLRLQQYKTSKGQRLVELENKVKQFQKVEQLDQGKLLAQVITQNKQLRRLQQTEMNTEKLVYQERIRSQVEIARLSRKLRTEGELKQVAFQKLDTFREEMHGNDQDPNSLAAIWRHRCEELLEETRNLRGQNGQLREKLVEAGLEAELEELPSVEQRPDSAYDYMTSFAGKQDSRLRAASLNR